MSKDPNRSAVWLAFCVIAIAIAAAVGLWIGRSPVTVQPVPGEQASASSATAEIASVQSPAGEVQPAAQRRAGRASSTAATSAESPPSPLPPANTPLADIFDELDQRARRGDAAAACRLGGELQRCRHFGVGAWGQVFRINEDRFAANLAGRDLSGDQLRQETDHYLRLDSAMKRIETVCADIQLDQLPSSMRYFEMAARAGHHLSTIEFITGALQVEDLFQDPDLIPLFKKNAPRYFRSALEAGEPTAFNLLRMITFSPHSVMSSVVPADIWDPPVVLALGRRLEAAYPGVLSPFADLSLAGEPTVEQQQRAEQFFLQYFANSERWHRAAGRPKETRYSAFEIDRFRCDED